MEMTGINEAAQLINVSINGIETTLKLSGSFLNWNIENIKSLGKILFSFCKKKSEELKPGENSFGDFLTKIHNTGDDIAVYNVDDNIVEEITNRLCQDKVPYSIFPDVNDEDGVKQIIIPDSYKSEMSLLAKQYNILEGEHQHIAISRTSLNETVNNAKPDLVENLVKSLSSDEKKSLDELIVAGNKDEDIQPLSDKWKELSGEVLILNDNTLDEKQKNAYCDSWSKWFSDKGIDACFIPNTKDGRTCILFDSDHSLDVRNLSWDNGAKGDDFIIQFSDYLEMIETERLSEKGEWFDENGIIIKNLAENGISTKILDNEDLSIDIVLSNDELVHRSLTQRGYTYVLKMNDDDNPSNECAVNIPRDRIKQDSNGDWHIKLLKNEKLFASYDENFESRLCEGKNSFVISGSKVKELIEKHPFVKMDRDNVIDFSIQKQFSRG